MVTVFSRVEMFLRCFAWMKCDGFFFGLIAKVDVDAYLRKCQEVGRSLVLLFETNDDPHTVRRHRNSQQPYHGKLNANTC